MPHNEPGSPATAQVRTVPSSLRGALPLCALIAIIAHDPALGLWRALQFAPVSLFVYGRTPEAEVRTWLSEAGGDDDAVLGDRLFCELARLFYGVAVAGA